jgi:putative transposase
MDEHYTDHCFKGANRRHTWLTMDKGYKVNHKRIERLYYDVMGLRAIMPGKHTSRGIKAHKVYPSKCLVSSKKIKTNLLK